MPDIFVPSNQKNTPPIHPIEKNSLGLFSSLCKNPDGVSFTSPETDEEVILFMRRHFITNLPWLTFCLILLTIPSLLGAIFSAVGNPFLFLENTHTIIMSLLFYAGVVAYAFLEFIHWYYNIGLLTQNRVVDVDFSDLLFHDISITKLGLIEDVNYRKSGFFGSLFNYGDVFIQTAGNKPNFDFIAVPNPSEVIHIIVALMGKDKPHG